MRIIKQRNDFDCGIAVAAMICGVSYRAAANADPHPRRRRGLTENDFRETCRSLGLGVRIIKPAHYRPFNTVACPSGTIAAIVRERGCTVGHWIAIDGDKVLDPDLGQRIAKKDGFGGRWLLDRLVTRQRSKTRGPGAELRNPKLRSHARTSDTPAPVVERKLTPTEQLLAAAAATYGRRAKINRDDAQ